MPRPGVYELIFEMHPTEGLHRREHAAFRAQLGQWVETAAVELHAEQPERLDRWHRPQGNFGSRSLRLDGRTITLTRRVHWSQGGRHDGALFIARNVGADLEAQRLVRIRHALARKLPKLLDCGREGDATCLILEWSDITLSNQIVIAEALERALADHPVWPDHILLADTDLQDHWHFFRPVTAGAFSIDMPYIAIEEQA